MEMKSMNTIILQTDKVTFLIISQNRFVSIGRKKGDVDFQKKSHPQMFLHGKPSAEQGIDPRSSHTVVFCAIGCATSTSEWFSHSSVFIRSYSATVVINLIK